jgi:hypothetical protein
LRLLCRFDGAGEAQLGDLLCEAVRLNLWRAVEVVGAEVFVDGAVTQHVVDCGQDRRGYGADGLLGASLVPQPLELRLIVGTLLSHRRPRALDQHGL